MKIKLLKIIFLIVGLFNSFNGLSQYYKLSNSTRISVLTCGSGNELYSIYGHTGLRVQDATNNIDLVYNYGNFDFATENFYLKFVKGDLQYFVAACSFQDFMYEYQVTNRQVWEQNLLLTTTQKQQLYDEINKTVFSEEKFYTYKFIDKNCTTMVLDKINQVFKTKIISKKTNLEPTYRTILYSFLDNHFWENFGINIIFGAKVDQPASKLFLPEELMSNLATSKLNGELVAEKAIILNKKTISASNFSFWNSIYPFCIFLLLIVIFNNQKLNIVYFLLLGLTGIFFSTVFIYSQHQEIYWNYNILLFNPSLLFLVYCIINKNKNWVYNLSIFNIICLGIYVLVLLNKVHLKIMIPIILCSSIIIFRLIFTNKRLLPSIK